MTQKRMTTGLLVIVMLAFWGLLLSFVPREIAKQYEWVSQAGKTWVIVYFSVVGTGAVIFLGATAYLIFRMWRRTREKQERRRLKSKSPSELTRDQQQTELDQNLESVKDYSTDDEVSEEVQREIRPSIEELENKREDCRLELVAFGTVSSGKSSLLNLLAGRKAFGTDPRGGTTVDRNEVPWPGMDSVTLVDTPGLGEVDGAEHVEIAAKAARDADIVLVVVDGPLRESEFQLLTILGQMEKRVLICLNKADWYDDEDQRKLVEQLSAQVRECAAVEDIIPVRSEPIRRERIRVAADGDEQTETIETPPDIDRLALRMMNVIRKDGRDLLLANLLLRSRGLVEEAQTKVQQALDDRAKQLVDTYMWAAGGAAAVSPLPVLDLLAGNAITAKMVVELARVYRQDVDLNTAVRLLGQMAKNLIAILGVGLATPAIVAGVGSLLKIVPGVGTVAGGTMQGVVQAVVTRWIGFVFMDYFKNEMKEPEGGIAGLARKHWSQVTSATELRKLVTQTRKRMKKDG